MKRRSSVLWITQAAEAYLLNQGRSEGIQQGISEGIQQGRLEGIQQEKRALAKTMLQAGEPMEKIIQWTGLSKRAMEQLYKRGFIL